MTPASDDSDSIRALLELAKQGQRDHAERALDALTDAQPDHAAAWFALAQVSSSRQKAVYCLDQVLRLQPDHQGAAQALIHLNTIPVSTPPVLEEAQSRTNITFRTLSAILVILLLIFTGLALNSRGGLNLTRVYQTDDDQAIRETTAPTTSPDMSQLVVETETEYYTVTGTTLSELRESLYANSPRAESKDIWAYTQTSFTFSVVSEDNVGECWLDGVIVRLKLRSMYPKWEPPGTPTAEATQAWEPFIAAVLSHQEQHAAIARDIGDTYLTTLRDLPSEPTCDQLSQSISAAIGRVEADGIQRQVAWDAQEGVPPFPLP